MTTTREGVHPQIQAAIESVNLPEVQKIIEQLAQYGLGVTVPHMHNDEGQFLPLPQGIVQSEKGCKVTFVPESELGEDAFAVAWRWNEQKQIVAICNGCGPSNGACY
jgi:hypothetical protein